MAKKARNYDQTAFKVGGSPQPADQVITEREKAKVTRAQAGTGGRQRHGKAKDGGE